MIVIANATPLIGLARINHLWLLQELFEEIVVPQAVYAEVAGVESELTGAAELRTALWLRRQALADRSNVDYLRADLDPGEAEVLVLAHELNADLVLLDETKARLAAEMLGLRFIGTIGVLLLAKRKGNVVALQPLLDHLRAERFYIGTKLYEMTLQSVGEM